LDYSLERLVFTGTTPFEVQDVRVHPDGLDLIFTEPADRDLAEDPENLSVTQFGYRYHAKYGSAQFDHEDQANRSTQILVKSATLSTDGLKLRLNLEGWRTGYVTAVRLALIENRAGEALWNDTFYYTLNQIPKQDVATRP
jgi:hypothetical protein